MGRKIDLSRAEALKTLQIDARTFRRLLKDFGEELGPAAAELGEETLAKLREIIRLRAEGRTTAEIAAALTGEVTGPPPEELLLSRLEEIGERLERSEERRLEDRDRLLTAVMRTQQEITHLRYEMSAGLSRRDRRKNLWTRFFGR